MKAGFRLVDEFEDEFEDVIEGQTEPHRVLDNVVKEENLSLLTEEPAEISESELRLKPLMTPFVFIFGIWAVFLC